ncbi:MAG: sensor histidine kinase [Synechococcaceae bacterium WB8_1B_136]|nr:sensor histidine kinase [Synechococcaceae bacterium WB8_1B_136]
MQVSKRLLTLLEQQLAQFTDRPDLVALVVYQALPGDNGKPSLVPIGQWPTTLALPTGADAGPQAPLGEARRWLALRDGELLLGALRVDADRWPWPPDLTQRLEATALCLAEALRLDLEQQRLARELARRNDQLKLLVHQLRNPLAALRTFGQLLRRRLDGDPGNRDLVDHLLAEQGQMNRYVEAINRLSEPAQLPGSAAEHTPLLLPPALGSGSQTLSSSLEPLLERAGATAALQGRPWHRPAEIPAWQGDGGAVTEIVANLLENAFRYSRAGGAIGLSCHTTARGVQVSVWDGGPAIPVEERERIFEKGMRGSRGQALEGSGLGLALARELAHSLGGELELISPPQLINPQDPVLPEQGNAFRLTLPAP